MATQRVQRNVSAPAESAQAAAPDRQNDPGGSGYAPKPLSARQTIVLTVKILAVSGAIFLLLWVLDHAKR
ncbi:MAG: hypothetical protein KIT09_12290 [Bryobacteraceae bacterium]|nr:hypothetical protein [Bryobacteraceae bacterium]